MLIERNGRSASKASSRSLISPGVMAGRSKDNYLNIWDLVYHEMY